MVLGGADSEKLMAASSRRWALDSQLSLKLLLKIYFRILYSKYE
jgi:hypothetical protein